jgi:hypothetical protein
MSEVTQAAESPASGQVERLDYDAFCPIPIVIYPS